MQWILKQPKKIQVTIAAITVVLLFCVGLLISYKSSQFEDVLKTVEPTKITQHPEHLINLFGEDKDPFIQPVNVVAGKQGIYYVADKSLIRAFDSNGKYLFSIGDKSEKAGQLKYPYGLAVTKEGNLLVTDVMRQEILKYDAKGKFLGVFVKSKNELGLKRPGYIALDEKDHIYISDLRGHQIIVLDKEAKLIKKFSLPKGGGRKLKFPQGIAIDNKARIWVADAGNKRIVAFDEQLNEVIEIQESKDVKFAALRGLSIDSLGRVFVADAMSKTIQVYAPDGKQLFNLNTAGEETSLLYPTGLYTKDGKLFIADRGNKRVQVWGYPGE